MSLKGIIFDLDGTLVDSVADITASVNKALSFFDAPALEANLVKNHIGLGVTQLMQGSLGESRQHLLGQASQLFLEDYQTQCTQLTTWYDNVESTLQELQSQNFLLALFTNKPKIFTQAILKKFGVENIFQPVVCGGDDGVPKKPDPTGLKKILEAWNLKTQECLFVGDSEFDIHTAEKIGMPFAIAAYGFGYPGFHLPHHFLLNNFKDVLTIVNKAKPQAT